MRDSCIHQRFADTTFLASGKNRDVRNTTYLCLVANSGVDISDDSVVGLRNENPLRMSINIVVYLPFLTPGPILPSNLTEKFLNILVYRDTVEANCCALSKPRGPTLHIF